MVSLLPLISLLLVIVVSLLLIRIATVALVLTGVSKQLARFQARSAFSGVGFTTPEAEKVTQHPVRRRIIMLLMLFGNAGIVTAVSTLILSFMNFQNASPTSVWLRIVGLVVGVTLVWITAHSPWVDRHITRIIEWTLKRWTDLEVRDYASLLNLANGYSVIELKVEPGDWLAQQELASLKLSDEGVLVLGVERADGSYQGAPRGQTALSVGDTVIMYGPSDVLENLDQRRAGRRGNQDHDRAVTQQRVVENKKQEQTGATREQ